MALQRLLPFQSATSSTADFKFIDLFAGIGGIRLAFDAIGGECVFTSEWDSFAQRTYMANFGGQHPINGDITQIAADDIPDHDVLLGGFPYQPSTNVGTSKKMHQSWAIVESVDKLRLQSSSQGVVRNGFRIDRFDSIMATGLWTKEQIKLAFHLYCQIPYGRIYGRNPEIIDLAKIIARTPDAVAMKMLNIASLDPAITGTGRSGLGNASKLDRTVWDEFHADWERLAVECQLLRQQFDDGSPDVLEVESGSISPEDFTGETRQVIAMQRVKQYFFRRTVLSSYRGRCCMSGLSDSRLLIASHIVPWSSDKANRLNPSNGLCLSAIHDRAFDKGLISLDDDFTIIVSEDLKRRDDPCIRTVFISLEGRSIEPPERFVPKIAFIAWHRDSIFLDNRK